MTGYLAAHLIDTSAFPRASHSWIVCPAVGAV